MRGGGGFSAVVFSFQCSLLVAVVAIRRRRRQICVTLQIFFITHTQLSTLYLCVCVWHICFHLILSQKDTFCLSCRESCQKISRCCRRTVDAGGVGDIGDSCSALAQGGVARPGKLLLLLVIKIKCLRAVIETTSDGINFV